MEQTLQQCETRLRAAAGARNLAETERLAGEYRASFDGVWQGLTNEERHRSELPAKAAELMRWALGVTMAHKARLLEQRREVRAASRYLSTGAGRPAGIWRTNG